MVGRHMRYGSDHLAQRFVVSTDQHDVLDRDQCNPGASCLAEPSEL